MYDLEYFLVANWISEGTIIHIGNDSFVAQYTAQNILGIEMRRCALEDTVKVAGHVWQAV